MVFKSSSRILVTSLLFGAAAWVLDAWVSSLIFGDAAFLELLVGENPERSIYVRSVVVLIIVLFGLYAGTLVSKLEVKHEAEKKGVLDSSEIRETKLKHQNSEAIGSLAGGFAHEFNNVLQVMMGSAYIADLQSGGEDSPIHQHLVDIQLSGARASKLCDQMLTYAGKKSVLIRELYVDKQLRALEPDLRAAAGTFPLDLAPGAPNRVMGGDAGLFRDLFLNLIKNAVEACGEKSISIAISTEPRECVEEDFEPFNSAAPLKPGSYVQIQVSDSGVGIPANVMDRIFDPFYSTKFQGRGLGLSEVMGIVRTFSGGVHVESELNFGTTFTFLFPAQQADELKPGRSSSIPSPAGHGLIWIVDDELLITQTLQRVLTRWGFQARTARSGEDFLEEFHAQASECSCVLLDLTMPGISGVEIHAFLKKEHPSVPVVMMSGYTLEQSLANFDEGSVAGFLHKPFPLESLEDILRDILPPESWSK